MIVDKSMIPGHPSAHPVRRLDVPIIAPELPLPTRAHLPADRPSSCHRRDSLLALIESVCFRTSIFLFSPIIPLRKPRRNVRILEDPTVQLRPDAPNAMPD